MNSHSKLAAVFETMSVVVRQGNEVEGSPDRYLRKSIAGNRFKCILPYGNALVPIIINYFYLFSDLMDMHMHIYVCVHCQHIAGQHVSTL